MHKFYCNYFDDKNDLNTGTGAALAVFKVHKRRVFGAQANRSESARKDEEGSAYFAKSRLSGATITVHQARDSVIGPQENGSGGVWLEV